MGRRVAQAQSRIDRIELMDRPAYRPDLPIVVIDRVGIEEPVAGRDMVALATRADVIKGSPKAERGDRPLDETYDASALPEVVGIRDEDGLARDAKHLADRLGRTRDVVQYGELADEVEFSVGSLQGIHVAGDELVLRKAGGMPYLA